ncbi:N-6 DNA methylase [Paenibacillus sp. 2003]|uniref:N-6 DNA methylase n=1 Tax=Paenibacillus TaxID=44249 RepID=UPI0028645C40|nr:N-6 DNA methylase [Paenibacillus sp. 2003]MDR6720553.1 hypothetical protein [Paenibacillus sp. 2003]
MENDKINEDYLELIENRFYYSLEVLRGNYFFLKNDIGLIMIAKIVYYKLKSQLDDNSAWHEILRTNEMYSSGGCDREEYMNRILHIINFEESRDIFFSNRHSSSVLREFIYNIDFNLFDNMYFTQKVAAEIFYKFNSKLFSNKYNTFFSGFENEELFSTIIQKIITINKKEIIYDPFIGAGGLLYKVLSDSNPNEVMIEGQDINALSLEICRLQFDLFGTKKFFLKHEDSLMKSDMTFRKYDKIVTQLPKINLHLTRSLRSEYSSYDYLLSLVLSQLNPQGQAYIIVPSTFLFSESKEQKIREQLINQDLIETVIEFSGNGLRRNTVNFAILIINKKKEYFKKNKIQVIEFHKKDYDELSYSIEKYEEGYNSRIIDYDRISKRNFNLRFNSFDPIFDEVKLMLHYRTGQKLCDIVEVVKPMNINRNLEVESGIPVVRISNLNRNLDEMYLDLNSREGPDYNIEFVKYKNLLKQKALILCIQGKDLRPTIFDPQYTKYNEVVLTNHCVALIIKEKFQDSFSIEDLYFNFYNPNVIRQVEAFKRGGIIQRIPYKDLLDVVIPKPEYEKQNQITKYQEQPLRELEKYKKMYEETLINLEQERIAAENKVVNMLIHNVSKHVSVVGHDILKLERFLYEQNLQNSVYAEAETQLHNNSPEVRNGLRERTELIRIGDIINITKERLELIEKTFSDTQKSINLSLEDKDFENIEIKSLLEEIKKDRGVNQPIPYLLEVTGEEVELYINKQSFKEMIHLLINNAEEHAFKSEVGIERYRIEFKVIKLSEGIIIEYYNNGSKFELSKEEFILAGRRSTDSKGSGLGGAYLNRVITSHNGNFEIGYSDQGVKFIFKFKGMGK